MAYLSPNFPQFHSDEKNEKMIDFSDHFLFFNVTRFPRPVIITTEARNVSWLRVTCEKMNIYRIKEKMFIQKRAKTDHLF